MRRTRHPGTATDRVGDHRDEAAGGARPSRESIYPSGHTGAWTALGLVTTLILIGWLSPRTTTRAVILAVDASIPGGAMALALVRFSNHYPSNTVGGFCAAVVCVLGPTLIVERIGGRSSRRCALSRAYSTIGMERTR